MPRLSTPGMLQARIQAIGNSKQTAALANAEANRQNELERTQILADSRVEAAQSSTPTLSFNRPGGLSGGFSGGGGLQGRSGSRLDNRGGLLHKRGSSRIQGKEHGGDINGKQPYLVGEKGVEAKIDKNGAEAVGENGPEIITPTEDGVIIPNHVLAKLDEQTLNMLGIIPAANGLDSLSDAARQLQNQNFQLQGGPYSNVPARSTIPQGQELATLGNRNYSTVGSPNVTSPVARTKPTLALEYNPLSDTDKLRNKMGGVLKGQSAGYPASGPVDKWTGNVPKQSSGGLSSIGKGAGRLAGQVAGGAMAGYDIADLVAKSGERLSGALQSEPSAMNIPTTARDFAINQLISNPLDKIGLLDPLQQGVNFMDSGVESLRSGLSDVFYNLDPSGIMSGQSNQPALSDAAKQSVNQSQAQEDARKSKPTVTGVNTNGVTNTAQPNQVAGQATPAYQPPQADPRLQQMFDNQNIQQPGSLNRAGLNQPGAYSPADVHDRQAYINQRDSGQNLTKFTPTNFDASGMDNYNAQGLNTSGTIQGAIPWQGDVRGLSRDQIGQLQLQQNLGATGAKDFNAAQLGQGQLNVAQQEAGTNYLKATQPQYSAKAVKQYDEFGNVTGEDLQSFQTQGEGAGLQAQQVRQPVTDEQKAAKYTNSLNNNKLDSKIKAEMRAWLKSYNKGK